MTARNPLNLEPTLEVDPSMRSDMPERDAEGYLVEPGDWNEDVARALALEENIELGDDHWDTIRFMRDYYDEHQVITDGKGRAEEAVRAVSLRLREAGLQDRRHASSARVEHGVIRLFEKAGASPSVRVQPLPGSD